jgi:tape measure domain-containing protein
VPITEGILVEIREDGTRTVQRAIDDLAQSMEGAHGKTQSLKAALMDVSRPAHFLRAALGALGLALGLRELQQYADTWLQIGNRIRVTTDSLEKAAAIQGELYKSAQATRQELDLHISLYQRGALAASHLGASEADLVKFTKAAGLALAIQGSNTQQTTNTLLQLGNMLGMVRMNTREFNSVNMNTPIIMQMVAKNLDRAHGSIGQLRQMFIHGTITSKEFFAAFLKSFPELQQRFNQVIPTIGQGFIVLSNAMTKFIGENAQLSGISTGIARGLIYLSKNFEALAYSIIAVGVALAVTFGPNAIAMLSRFAVALAASTGGASLIVGAFAGATTAIYLFRDSIVLSEKAGYTLGDAMSAVWTSIADGAYIVSNYIRQLFTTVDEVSGSQITASKSLMEQFLTDIRSRVTMSIGTWTFYFKVISIIGRESWAALADYIMSSINGLIQRAEAWANVTITTYNLLQRILHTGAPEIPLIDIPEFENKFAGAAAKIKQDLKTAFGDSFLFADKLIEEFIARVAQANTRRRAIGAIADLTRNPPPEAPAPPAGLNKLRTAYEHLENILDPINAALRRLNEAEVTLNQAMAAGIITLDRKNTLMDRARAYYNDALHPYLALINRLKEETEAMQNSHSERRAGFQLLEEEKRLKKAGHDLTTEQREDLLKWLIANQEARKEADMRQRLEDSLTKAIKESTLAQRVLTKMVAEGTITAKAARQELATLRNAAGNGTWSDGWLRGFDLLSAKVENFSSRAGELFANLTDGLVNGFADALAQGIVFGESMEKILGNLARNLLAELISGLIKLGIQMVLNAILGKSIAAGAAATSVATATATGSAIASSYSTAAAMASLASFGANAVPATSGISSTVMFARSMALLGQFEKGGYTGNFDRKGIAGIVHGQEFVVNADATSKHRALLEALNRGSFTNIPNRGVTSGFTPNGAAPVVNVSIQNNTPARIDVEQDGSNIRIIAREEAVKAVHDHAGTVVASQIIDANSRVSRALNTHTSSGRKR